MSSLFTPGERVGPYLIDAFLGEGSVADIYGARRPSDGSRHALKLLAEQSTEQFQRMSREAAALSRIKHPNVIRVTELLHTRLGPALVREWVHGVSLRSLLKAHQPSEAEAMTVLRGLLRGISAAHAAGIVHRDLSPGTVMLKVSGRSVVPMIADFGLAKEVTDTMTLTRTGMYIGSPAYLAPEQIRSAKDVDHRADLYALGVILYEMLTGNLPVDSINPVVLYEKKIAGDYPDIEQLVPDVSRSTAKWVRKLLAPEPDDRPESAEAVLKSMRASSETEAISGPMADVADQLTRGTKKAFPTESRRSTTEEVRRASQSSNVATWVAFGLVGMGLGTLMFGLAVGLAVFAWWA